MDADRRIIPIVVDDQGEGFMDLLEDLHQKMVEVFRVPDKLLGKRRLTTANEVRQWGRASIAERYNCD